MCACGLPVGAQARLMSQALRKIAGNASKCNCTVLFLNQLRHKVAPNSTASCSFLLTVGLRPFAHGMHLCTPGRERVRALGFAFPVSPTTPEVCG